MWYTNKFTCLVSETESGPNLWPFKQIWLTLKMNSLFACLLSEDQLVMRYRAIDRDALPSAGATENLSKLK